MKHKDEALEYKAQHTILRMALPSHLQRNQLTSRLSAARKRSKQNEKFGYITMQVGIYLILLGGIRISSIHSRWTPSSQPIWTI